MSGVYACECLSLIHLGKAFQGKPRRKPESGNPTFRACRGACGNVLVSRQFDTVSAPRLYPDHVRFYERLGVLVSRRREIVMLYER